jgi:hypothetical protein
MPVTLEMTTPSSLDLDPMALQRLHETITSQVTEGRYPGGTWSFMALTRGG